MAPAARSADFFTCHGVKEYFYPVNEYGE